MNKYLHAGMLGLVFLVLVGMFFLGADAFINQLPASRLSGFGLYAVAFATGVWSTLVAVFLVNYVSVRRWGTQAIRLDPRLR